MSFSVCLSVSRSVRISKTIYPCVTRFSAPVACDLWLGVPLAALRYDVLCTSGFLDDVVFAHNERPAL